MDSSLTPRTPVPQRRREGRLGSQLALRHLRVAGHFDRGLPVRPFVRARGDPRQPSAQVNTWRPASPVQADKTDVANAAGVDPQDPFFVVSSGGTAMRVIAFGILALIVSLAAIHEPSSDPATMMAEQATTLSDSVLAALL
jgi:hypothetical protein